MDIDIVALCQIELWRGNELRIYQNNKHHLFYDHNLRGYWIIDDSTFSKFAKSYLVAVNKIDANLLENI